jgi:hypothetical protein
VRRRFVTVQAKATKQKVGFRWDPANLRWVRDDKAVITSDDPNATLIKPKTGAAYRVSISSALHMRRVPSWLCAG